MTCFKERNLAYRLSIKLFRLQIGLPILTFVKASEKIISNSRHEFSRDLVPNPGFSQKNDEQTANSLKNTQNHGKPKFLTKLVRCT